jgi:hypothetical protein
LFLKKIINANNKSNSIIQYDSKGNGQSSNQSAGLTSEYFDELCTKYSIQFNEPSSQYTIDNQQAPSLIESTSLNQKLEEIRIILKNELKKQYKLQEGAEKMRQATAPADKKSLQKLGTVIKETNVKIDELSRELLDLNSFLVISQSESPPSQQQQQQHHGLDSFNDEHSPERNSFSNGSSNSSGRPSAENSNVLNSCGLKGRSSSTSGLNQNMHADSNETIRLTPHEQRMRALNRQLEIEMKIKVGAENMLQSFSQGPKKDKKLCDDAQAMLKDAKLKIGNIIEINLLIT